MMKLILILTSVMWLDFGFASGGGGGGSGGGAAAGGAVSRAKEASPKKVFEAREKMRQRLQTKKQQDKAPAATGFDHSYASTTALLKKSVSYRANKQKSIVNYLALSTAEINKTANELLAASKNQVMKDFTKDQRLAYFINLYNVLTLKLIKDGYKEIKSKKNSINDLGNGLFNKPWDQKFFTLFGKKSTLNMIEHGFIRGAKGGYAQSKKEYNDPRIHFAVNCASKGCPALLDKAFTAKTLKSDMQMAMVNFLKDRDRNGVRKGKLYLSPIISDWYEEDFEKGFLGYTSVKDFAAKNAKHLASDAASISKIQNKKLSIKSSEYDWTLNDAIK